MKSLTALPENAAIAALLARDATRFETSQRIVTKAGLIMQLTMRDKPVIEDPYLVGVRAEAHSVTNSVPSPWVGPPRSLRDVFVRTDILLVG